MSQHGSVVRWKPLVKFKGSACCSSAVLNNNNFHSKIIIVRSPVYFMRHCTARSHFQFESKVKKPPNILCLLNTNGNFPIDRRKGGVLNGLHDEMLYLVSIISPFYGRKHSSFAVILLFVTWMFVLRSGSTLVKGDVIFSLCFLKWLQCPSWREAL